MKISFQQNLVKPKRDGNSFFRRKILLPLSLIVCSFPFTAECESSEQPDLKLPCELTSLRDCEPRAVSTASSSEEAAEELLAFRLALSERKGYHFQPMHSMKSKQLSYI